MPTNAIKKAISTLQNQVIKNQPLLVFLTTLIRKKSDSEVKEAAMAHKVLVDYFSDVNLPNAVKEAWQAIHKSQTVSLDDEEASLEQQARQYVEKKETKETKSELKQTNPADILSTITQTEIDEANERLKDISLADEKSIKAALTQAAISGNLALLQLLHAKGHHGNHFAEKKERPLYVAIECGQLKAALLILQLNPRIDPDHIERLTSRNNHCHSHFYSILINEIEKIWCGTGAPLWKLYPSTWHQRAFHGGPYLEAMTEKDLILKSSIGLSPLFYAIANPDKTKALHTVKQLCELYTEYGLTIPADALGAALSHDRLDITKLLIENYNLIPQEIFKKASALHIAQSSDIVEYLINEAKLDIHAKYEDGSNVLLYPHGSSCSFIFSGNSIKKAKILFAKGLDVNDKDDDGITLLSKLFDLKKIDYSPEEWQVRENMLQCLIEHKADVNLVDEDGWSPLHFATKNNNWPDIVFLLMHGADINLIAKKLNGPLGFAVECSSSDVVKLLLSLSANVNQRNFQGYTPLFWADTLEMMTLLIENGALTTIKSHQGYTLLNNALRCSDPISYTRAQLFYQQNPEDLTKLLGKGLPDFYKKSDPTSLKKVILTLLHSFRFQVKSSIMNLRCEYHQGELSYIYDEDKNSIIIDLVNSIPNLSYLIAGLIYSIDGYEVFALNVFYNRALLDSAEKEYVLITLGDIYLAHAEHQGFPNEFKTNRPDEPNYELLADYLKKAIDHFVEAKQFDRVINIAQKIEKFDFYSQERNEYLQLQQRHHAPDEIKKLLTSQVQNQEAKKILTLQKLQPLGFFEKRKMSKLSEKLNHDNSSHYLFPVLSYIITSLKELELTAKDHLAFAQLVRDHYPLVPLDIAAAMSIALSHINKAMAKQINTLEKEWRQEEKIESAVQLIAETRMKNFPEIKEDHEPEAFKIEKARLKIAEDNLSSIRKDLALLKEKKFKELKDPLLKDIINYKEYLENIIKADTDQISASERKDDNPSVAPLKLLTP